MLPLKLETKKQGLMALLAFCLLLPTAPCSPCPISATLSGTLSPLLTSVERNLREKLPQALSVFHPLVDSALTSYLLIMSGRYTFQHGVGVDV